jgi:hypothetical protein
MHEEQPIRVVVGEGRAQRQGLLGFVLEGEGIQVVATATTPAELARSLAEHQPDVVVLDDGIGSIAVSMTRQMLPRAKVVVVWPRGVVAIDGDASVEPSEVLRQLGATVDRVMSPAPPPVVAFRRAGSGTARGRTRGRGAIDPNLRWNGGRHSTVTRIHGRPQRSHPSTGMRTDGRPDPIPPTSGGVKPTERELAEVVVLPVSNAAHPHETPSPEPPGPEQVEVIPESKAVVRIRRRRPLLVAATLVPVCLVASILTLAGSRHVPVGVVRAEKPVVVPPIARAGRPGAPVGSSAITADQRGKRDHRGSPLSTTGGGTASSGTGAGQTPSTPGSNGPGGGSDPGQVETVPGQSGDRNPHGGPPGLLQGRRPVLSTG